MVARLDGRCRRPVVNGVNMVLLVTSVDAALVSFVGVFPRVMCAWIEGFGWHVWERTGV